MTITLNGTTGITTPSLTSDAGITADGISFADGTPSNTLVTTTGGNVGIGTSSPQNNSTFTTLTVDGTNSIIEMRRSGSRTGRFYVDSTGTTIGAYTATPLMFITNDTERMRIDSSGNLLVGNTAPIGSETVNVTYNGLTKWGMAFEDSSASGTNVAIRFYHNASLVGSITNSTTTTAYNTSSDYRLKENIAPMAGALAKVQALKPVTYTWKSTGEADEGFIAHELAEVCPSAVTGEKDAVDTEGNPVYQGIDTSFLVATLTAAIQELKAELDTVKTELATLKGTA